MDSAPEMMCRWVERHPRTKERIGGAARPACRAATTITTSNSPADNASCVDACVPARHSNRVALPAFHSHSGTSGSPYYTHVADYKDTSRRTRDAATRRRQLARHMPSACAGTSIMLLRWTPEKKHAVQRLLTRTAIQPCYTCPRSPSSCVDFKVPLLIGAYTWRQRVHGAKVPHAAYV
jgi:hypothetical protein